MIRKLLLVVVALAVSAASGLAVVAPTHANGVQPVHGKYVGEDHGDLNIGFQFNGGWVYGFKVGHHEIGAVRVSDGVWHETCRDGYCVKGHWQLDSHVVGHWRSPSGHWTAFHASAPGGHQPITPHPGVYVGRDVHGGQIQFTYDDRDGWIRHFLVNVRPFVGHITMAGGGWSEQCDEDRCVKGHWTEDGHVTGAWRRGGDWVHFSASFRPPTRLNPGRYTSFHGVAAIELTYNNGRIETFGTRGREWGRDIPVTDHHFHFCGHAYCVRGHWQTESTVVGSWRQVGHQHPRWDSFDLVEGRNPLGAAARTQRNP